VEVRIRREEKHYMGVEAEKKEEKERKRVPHLRYPVQRMGTSASLQEKGDCQEGIVQRRIKSLILKKA